MRKKRHLWVPRLCCFATVALMDCWVALTGLEPAMSPRMSLPSIPTVSASLELGLWGGAPRLVHSLLPPRREKSAALRNSWPTGTTEDLAFKNPSWTVRGELYSLMIWPLVSCPCWSKLPHKFKKKRHGSWRGPTEKNVGGSLGGVGGI